MLFFFKQKPIHLDCFTSKQSAYEFSRVDYTTKFLPEWWKMLPKGIPHRSGLNLEPTMKSCVGFNEFFKHGVTIPLWADLACGANEAHEYAWRFSDPESETSTHDVRQMEGYLDPFEYGHVKLVSPWLFDCSDNTDWAWVQNTWGFNNPSDVIIPPGIVTYKYQANTDISLFINLRAPKTFTIPHGTPMVNVIPLTDRPVKLHVHLISQAEFFNKKEKFTATSFLNKYRKQKKIIDANEPKCPFHFGK